LASQNGHVEVVRILLQKGAAVNIKNSNGKTAQEIATESCKAVFHDKQNRIRQEEEKRKRREAQERQKLEERERLEEQLRERLQGKEREIRNRLEVEICQPLEHQLAEEKQRNGSLERHIILLEERVKSLEAENKEQRERLLNYDSITVEEALCKALEKLEIQWTKNQQQQEETDRASVNVNSLFVKVKEVHQELANHVKALVKENKGDDASINIIQERDKIMEQFRGEVEKTLSIVSEEILQHEKESEWGKLIRRVDQYVQREAVRANNRIKRIQELEKCREHLTKHMITVLNVFDSKRKELEKIKQDLDIVEQDVRQRVIEVRNLKNEEDNAPSERRQVVKAKLAIAKKRRDEAKLQMEQLQRNLVEKSRQDYSLPEYELKVSIQGEKNEIPRMTGASSVSNDMMIKNYRVEEELMGGAQTRLYLCRPVKDENVHVVIKVYQVYSLTDAETGIRECRMIQSLNHRNIVQILDFFPLQHEKLKSCFCIVMPYYSEGDLGGLINKYRGTFISCEIVLRIVYQLAQGLKIVHDQGLIHRDIKPQNCFVSQEGKSLVIGDFGLAKNIGSMTSKASLVGTEDYMAPEMKKQRYGSPSDIWSLGCIVYELLSMKHRNMAFERADAAEDGKVQEFYEELRKDMSQSGLYPGELIELVLKMLNRDAAARPTAKLIVDMHSLFGSIAEEQTQIDESNLCVICLDKIRTHPCIPCGHKVLCADCAPAIQDDGKCPVCRAEIANCNKIYDS
jgi:hypothetical protein